MFEKGGFILFASRPCLLLEDVSDFTISWISITFSEFKFQIHSREVSSKKASKFCAENLFLIFKFSLSQTTSNQPSKNIYRWSWIPTNFWLIAFVAKFCQQNNFISKVAPNFAFLAATSYYPDFSFVSKFQPKQTSFWLHNLFAHLNNFPKLIKLPCQRIRQKQSRKFHLGRCQDARSVCISC